MTIAERNMGGWFLQNPEWSAANAPASQLAAQAEAESSQRLAEMHTPAYDAQVLFEAGIEPRSKAVYAEFENIVRGMGYALLNEQ